MKFKIPKSVRNFLILIVIAFFVKTSILEIYVVPTGSMLDTIEVNDAIIGNKFIYGLRTPNWIGIPFTRNGFYIPSFRFPAFKEIDNGDISIFEFPNDDYVKYVKRCIGLPGQYVKIKNGEIFLGDSLSDLQYREDLTYPEQSKFTKQRKKVLNIMGNSNYTEKASPRSFIISPVFDYYEPIEVDGYDEKIISQDNMQLQVPYKGMEIDLSDPNVEFSSALMLLLLDGYKIQLQNYSDAKLGIDSSKKYEFHKYDYESIAKTSMTIKNWFTGLGKGRFALPIMFAVIVYTAYVLFSRKKEYHVKKKISQSVTCLVVVSLILYLSNRDMISDASVPASIAKDNIINDINDGFIPLTYFFDNSVDIDSYKTKSQIALDKKIRDLFPYSGILIQNYTQSLLQILYQLEPFKDDSIQELRRRADIKDISSNDYFFVRQYRTPETKMYFNDPSFRYQINTIINDYYQYEITKQYRLRKIEIEYLKNILYDKILIDGKLISEQSKFDLRHNYYFMVGDNHNNSADSRSWGFVPDYNLLGQPVITLVNFAKFKFKFDFLL